MSKYTNVNVAAKTAALASLHDLESLRQNVTKIIAERERLYQKLTKFEFLQPYPSQANFILCRVMGRDAYHLKRDLEQRGILIRYYNKPGLFDHVRFSVGRPEHTDRLIGEMKKL